MLKLLLAAALLTTPHEPTNPRHSFPKPVLRDTTETFIVIHYDSGNSTNVILHYLRKTHKSYHYYIERNGHVIQLVDPTRLGAHAGASRYGLFTALNWTSVGICLQNMPPQNYTGAQYTSLIFLIQQLQRRWPNITINKIVGHENIAWPRGRKRDPGPKFDWARVRIALAQSYSTEKSKTQFKKEIAKR